MLNLLCIFQRTRIRSYASLLGKQVSFGPNLEGKRVKLQTKRKMSKAPYGSWSSPISSKLITESAVALKELSLDQDSEYTDHVYWNESRPDEGGRCVVCSYNIKTKQITSITPKDYNVRSTVHEYGGKSYFVVKGTVYFSNFVDQVLYSQQTLPALNDPVAVTEKDKGLRFIDGVYSNKKNLIYCIRESHVEGKEAVNTVVSVSPSSGQQSVIKSGADFYSDARVSPDGKKICWIEWNHPNMPWDSTNLYVGELTELGTALVDGSLKKIETGNDNSIMEPVWLNSNTLYYISDQSDWWNLYHVNESGQSEVVLERKEEIGLPKWQCGGTAYSLDRTSTKSIAMLYSGVVEILDTESKKTEIVETGFKTHREILWSASGDLYCFGYSDTQFACLIQVNLQSKKVTQIKVSQSLALESGYFSLPTVISWTTEDKETSHGLFYPPQNKDFTGLDGELPPLLVRAHGGPTSAYGNSLELKLQYFTSRGFAVLLVNYRGSTGYGKNYRHRLRDNWGICDVDDCCSGALHLASEGKVDKNKLCIDGGSAGGYTTLACLTFKDVFKVGVSHYGVADIEALALETHKFESRYMDRLVAPVTDEGRKIYRERSPIHSVEKINCAMAFFQGDEDKIVPPNQAEMMYKAVKAKGKPAVLVMFQGEQHGFRKAQNIQDALDGEFYFLSRVLGFKADSSYTMKIDNID